jgi:hypothetical protein
MPRLTEAALITLRMRYRTAYEAYQSCVKALTEAGANGNKPSVELLDNEVKAVRRLAETRAALLVAMAEG